MCLFRRIALALVVGVAQFNCIETSGLHRLNQRCRRDAARNLCSALGEIDLRGANAGYGAQRGFHCRYTTGATHPSNRQT